MPINLYKNATRTLASREAIQKATGGNYQIALQRDMVTGGSHISHRLQTTLNAHKKELVIYVRTHLFLPLDDLFTVAQEFIEPAMIRPASDRIRRRHSCLPARRRMLRATTPSSAQSRRWGRLVCNVARVRHLGREPLCRLMHISILGGSGFEGRGGQERTQ